MAIRRTKKAKAAILQGLRLVWPLQEGVEYETAEELYKLLEEKGFMWDSKQGEWIDLANEPSDEPTELIMIRCWADVEIVEEVADRVEKKFRKEFKKVDRSKVYLCRPPKHLEGRVYLQFMKKEKA